ncbi:fimbrial protein [Enterobacter hormaechei]|uniref:fimbrial protein n=1 Tax=Enterobacter hormaechei TaxID=158836 RepID=UPI002949F950|nr:fimbrial protein [Enterobacter hormaechei]MDV5526881.1 fimbrial protein [Enterobacter hormaechei]
MKKSAIALTLFAVLGATVSSANAASTGTITFNGELTATTCDAVVDNQAANATVVLPTVGTNQLVNLGETAGRTGFNIALTNCQGTLKTASAFFEAGPTVDLASGHLLNKGGSATNVSLQLRDESSANGDVIVAGNGNQAANTTYVDVSSGSANLPYSVEYFADAATTAGTVISQVVYSIQYM